MYDCIIVGMGISGITAAIYAKRSNLNVLLLDKSMPGGLLNTIDKITNYPGIPSISGSDFALNLLNQLKELEIPYKLEEVIELDLDNPEKKVKTTNATYSAKNVILALGRTPRHLGIAGEEELLGHGISTCAMCDGFFYKGKDIAIVGTGNSALQETLYLAKMVNKIYLINRRDGFRGDKILIDEVKKLPNIEIICNSNITKLNTKNDRLESITLDNFQTIKLDGLFLYIGFTPATKIVPSEILTDDGYIKVDEKFKTPIDGVFAIGDVIKKDVYQLVTATSDGAIVINNLK